MGQQPDVGPIGHLDKQETMAAFLKTVDVFGTARWKTEAQANLEHIAEPAMRALRGAGIPEPTLVATTVSTGLGAVFHPTSWTIQGASVLYDRPRDKITEAYMRAKAGDLYHEARHAEQFYMAAQAIAERLKRVAPTALSKAEQNLLARISRRAWKAAEGAPAEPSDTAASRRIASWMEDYLGIEKVMKGLQDARGEMDTLSYRLVDDQIAIPGEFTSEDDCEFYSEVVSIRTEQADLTRKLYRTAFENYLGLSFEVDAYDIGARVGGSRPDAAERTAEVFDRVVGPGLEQLKFVTGRRVDAFRAK